MAQTLSALGECCSLLNTDEVYNLALTVLKADFTYWHWVLEDC